MPQRLQHYAIAFGELDQLLLLLGARVGVEVEVQADLAEADRRVLRHAERAAEIEISLGAYRSVPELNAERGSHRLKRDAGTGDQRLEQHVARARLQPAAAGAWMQASLDQCPAGVHAAGDALADAPLGAQGDERRLRVGAVALLDRSLEGLQLFCVHGIAAEERPSAERL